MYVAWSLCEQTGISGSRTGTVESTPNRSANSPIFVTMRLWASASGWTSTSQLSTLRTRTKNEQSMKNAFLILLLGSVVSALAGLAAGQVTSGSPDGKKLSPKQEEAAELKACVQHLAGGFLKVPDTRELRFQGKVTTPTARCRGGQQAVEFQFTPWVDWARYWGAGDSTSLPVGFLSVKGPQLPTG